MVSMVYRVNATRSVTVRVDDCSDTERAALQNLFREFDTLKSLSEVPLLAVAISSAIVSLGILGLGYGAGVRDTAMLGLAMGVAGIVCLVSLWITQIHVRAQQVQCVERIHTLRSLGDRCANVYSLILAGLPESFAELTRMVGAKGAI